MATSPTIDHFINYLARARFMTEPVNLRAQQGFAETIDQFRHIKIQS